MTTKAYGFTTGGHANHWEAVQALCEEVGWRFRFGDAAICKLKVRTHTVKAERGPGMDRLGFIRRLCAEADVQGCYFVGGWR